MLTVANVKFLMKFMNIKVYMKQTKFPEKVTHIYTTKNIFKMGKHGVDEKGKIEYDDWVFH